MPSSGSGTGTPVSSGVAPTTIAAAIPNSCVTLKRYAEIIGYPQCNFFGVNNSNISTGFQCREIWSKFERDTIAHYLAEAQDELEQEIGYPLCARWIGENEDQLWRDNKQQYKRKILTRFCHVIESGIKATSTISAGEAIDYTNDPAVVGPIATTVTDTSEIAVFYPDSDRVVYPYSITISGGNLTIWIERCHLVDPDYLDNPDTGLDYTDLTNFLSTVDVKRIYNSTATEATIVYPACSTCSETTAAGCIYIINSRVGIVEVKQTTSPSNLCGCSKYVNLNYKAGLETLSRQGEDAIVRLAHSKMPTEPCGCAVTQRLWARDRNIPDVLTRERLNCPFGLNDGAWIAWKFAQSMKIMRGGNL